MFGNRIEGKQHLATMSLYPQDNEMIVLATARNMEILEASDTLSMDGTFKSALRIFSQLYSIHGVSYGRVVPLMYCLLADKSRATYYKMFRILKVSFIPLTNCANSLNVPLHTTTVVLMS